MSNNNRQQKELDKEKQRLMNGGDINLEKQQLEENKRQVGNCVSDFTVVKELGRGSFGIVYKIISNINKKEYVMKKINIKHMSSKHQTEALKEAQILRKVRHESIIKYYTSFVEHDCLYIIMEYADGGDLQQLLRNRREKKIQFTEAEIWDYAQDLIKAVDYLHKNNIIHRDIKTLNIFLTKDRKVKLGDLGVSKIVSSQVALQGTRVGTPLYLAPELVKQQPYDFKVDIWAIGIVLYHISAQEPPFQGENLIALGFNIVHKSPKPLPMSFINKLLEKNPFSRPNTTEILESFPKKNERPMTGKPIGQSAQQPSQQNIYGRQSSQQNLNDKIEIFDKGNYNLLNKIIQEDKDMAVPFCHKLDNKKKSLELNEQESRPQSSVLPYHMRRPQTSIGRDKEKIQKQKIIDNINNGYNNMNIKPLKNNILENYSDNQNALQDDPFSLRKQRKNKQSGDSRDNSSSSSNNNNKEVSNSNNPEYVSPTNSYVNRNFGKNKEVMTYNKKKMSLITDNSTIIEDKKKNESSSTRYSTALQQVIQNNVNDNKKLSANNKDQKNQNQDQQYKIQPTQLSYFPSHKVSSQSQQIYNTDENCEKILVNTKRVQKEKDKKYQIKNDQMRQSLNLVQNKSPFKSKSDDIQQFESYNKRKFLGSFEEAPISVQKQNVENNSQSQNKYTENIPFNNDNDQKLISDSKQLKQQQKLLKQNDNLKESKEENDITECMKEQTNNNNTNNANKNEVKGQNPLVAYFNISKSINENLQNNFKIRPFSAQTKPRQNDLIKKNELNNLIKNDPITQSSKNKDTFKIEQIIKEFKQEAQNIKESPLNTQSNILSIKKPTIEQKDQKTQQENQKNEKINSLIQQLNVGSIQQSSKKEEQNKQNQLNKNNAINEQQKKDEDFFRNENIGRPQSAIPLIGNRQNKLFNEFNHRYVLGTSPNFINGFISPFQQNSNTSHKQVVNNFIKNSIGKMSNNVIIDPVKKSQQKEFPQSSKSNQQKVEIAQKTKSVTSANFYKDQLMTNSVKGSNSTNIEFPQQSQHKEKQSSTGKVLLFNNSRPQTSTGIRKKFTIKDLVSEQMGYNSNQMISQ